jgi:hypothetical protein
MPEVPVDHRKYLSFLWISLAALVLSIIIVGVGIYRAGAHQSWDLLLTGIVCSVVTIATLPVSMILGRVSTELKADSDARSAALNERLEQFSVLLNLITEQQLLSDRAKSVAFRDKDRDALRRAIQEEINRQDWDAALRLADEIEAQFGYRTEAARFRDEIRQRQQEQVRRQIQEVVTVIDRYTRSEQWNGALREAERLMGMFPDNEQVKNLPHEIDRRRQEHKKHLIDSFHDAAARQDWDGAIEILKQLDAYLTPAEGEGMQETARHVFKEKLNTLSKQFADAVHELRWTEAIRVGDQISREFPNTRMAQEVREKMDTLKQRAAEVAGGGAAPAGAGSAAPVAVGAPA